MATTDDAITDVPTVSEEAARPFEPTAFARDLAAALADPVVRALVLGIVRDGFREELQAERARAQLARDEAASEQANTPQPNYRRASSRTSWVGERAAQQREGGR